MYNSITMLMGVCFARNLYERKNTGLIGQSLRACLISDTFLNLNELSACVASFEIRVVFAQEYLRLDR